MGFTPLPATPRPFTYGSRELYGYVTAFTSNVPRRVATHEFPKRDGALQEDMGAGFRVLKVQLVFTGDDCAAQYKRFEDYVRQNPTATLTHPVAGQWPAFCTGPETGVALATGIDKLEVSVTFLESQLDAEVNADTPDVATAAQNCTNQQSKLQQSVATFMVKLAKLQTASVNALNSLDSALDQITTTVTAPVSFARTVVNETLGTASNLAGVLANVQAASDALVADVGSFVTTVNTLFDASSDTSLAGLADSVNNLFGVVQSDAAALEGALLAAGGTPAGSADAVMDTEVMVDYCATLFDAYTASRPPTAQYTVQSVVNVITLAQRLISDLNLTYDALTYASILMGLNRISTPQAIPAGTVLTIITG